MSRDKRITFLRISYWAGALFDSLVVVPMLSPKIATKVFGIANFEPGNDYRYATYIAASLMAGWVFLLFWADRKPMERKGVLLLTIFPALVGLIFSGFYAVNSNVISVERMLPTWIMQGLLVFLFGFSYLKARTVSTPANNESSNKVAGLPNRATEKIQVG